ncbi:hypothetical protein [uncultured Brevundimonas sp.]|uniref:hypothetical protein n=1 Tax=uncultured Brevundimonas sp. TaxID=213418 RepID=UPI0025D8722F|nr:hypothetical protein [uncultured Brevundimonas sp.]
MDVVLVHLQPFDGQVHAVPGRIGQAAGGQGQDAARPGVQAPRQVEIQPGAAVQRRLEPAFGQAPVRHGDRQFRQALAARRRQRQGAAAQPARLGPIGAASPLRDRQHPAIGGRERRRAGQVDHRPGRAGREAHRGRVHGEGEQRALHPTQFDDVVAPGRAEQGPGAVGGAQRAFGADTDGAVADDVQIQVGPAALQRQVSETDTVEGRRQRAGRLQGRIPAAQGQAAGRQDQVPHLGLAQAGRGGRQRQRRLNAPAQGVVARDPDLGPGRRDDGCGGVQTGALNRAGGQAGVGRPVQPEGLDPPRDGAVEPGGQFGVARPNGRGPQQVAGQTRVQHGATVAASGLQVGIGQVAGQVQDRAPALGRAGAEPIGGGGEAQGHAVAGRGQVQDGGQTRSLHIAALEGAGGQARGQAHQLAVVDPRVGQ